MGETMITIVTDSTCYLSRSEAQEIEVKIVPVTYTVNGQNYNETYVDGNGDFEKLISHNTQFQTSQPNISAFLSAFREIINDGNDILCLIISSRLSGSFSSALAAAKELNTDRITVFDSYTTAGGLYILAKEARSLAASGMGIEEISAKLRTRRDQIKIAFSVDDMTPLRKSGRLGIVRQSIGTILNIKPLLMCVDGGIVSAGVARGTNEMIRKLVSQVPQDTKWIIIHYIENIGLAKVLYKEIQLKFPAAKLEMRKVGPVLSIHLGLSAIGLAWS